MRSLTIVSLVSFFANSTPLHNKGITASYFRGHDTKLVFWVLAIKGTPYISLDVVEEAT